LCDRKINVVRLHSGQFRRDNNVIPFGPNVQRGKLRLLVPLSGPNAVKQPIHFPLKSPQVPEYIAPWIQVSPPDSSHCCPPFKAVRLYTYLFLRPIMDMAKAVPNGHPNT
jgi:hypothetical protein